MAFPSWVRNLSLDLNHAQDMLRFLLTCCACLLSLADASGQKKVDPVIPPAERRKIVRARNLFNAYRIYEGERILKNLVQDHPLEAYYHEALVQMQRQVLARLGPAKAEYEQIAKNLHPAPLLPGRSNNPDEETGLAPDDKKQPGTHTEQAETENEDWNGLEPGERKTDRSRLHKKTEDNTKDEADHPLQDAVVTKDSTLLKEDMPDGDDSNLPLKMETRKHSRALDRELQELADLARIPPETYLTDFLSNCRYATLQVEYADSASSYLRQFYVDTLDPDLHVEPAAREILENILETLRTGSLRTAMKELDKLVMDYPDYYAAYMLQAETAKGLSDDEKVLLAYRTAARIRPDRPEPLFRLSQFHYARGQFNEAGAACIDAILLYPEASYMHFLQRIAQKTGKPYNTQWIRREVYPLSTTANFFERTAKQKTPWWTYQATESDVHDAYDSLGIRKAEASVKERYLEVYAWKQVLDDTSRFYFPFARAMRKAGYLDCYVLVSCFHQDLYTQFADLAKHDPQKIRDYFFVLMNWENKKFDKLRKEFFITLPSPDKRSTK